MAGRGWASPAAPGTLPRLDSLTGLRWWAALAVFVHHMTNFAALPIHESLRLGAHGVAFFFVLSGFVLTWSARPSTPLSTFYWRRFARIWPAHMVALLLAVPVFVGPPADLDHTWVRPLSAVLLLSVVLLHGWWLNTEILFSGNPASWTLSLEAFFYATHPWADRLLGRAGARAVLVILLLVPLLGGLLHLLRAGGVIALPWPLMRWWEFFLGMSLAHAVRLGWRPRLSVSVALAVMVGVWAAVSFGPHLAPQVWSMLHLGALSAAIVPTVCGLIIAAFAVREVRGIESGSGFGRPRAWLIRLGEWSFAFYLLHATIIYGGRMLLGRFEVSWWNLAVYAVVLVMSIAAAWALHTLIEHPVERRLRRWKDERDRRRHQPALS